jgi:flagellar biosynthesis anti-sigma factor FlgM
MKITDIFRSNTITGCSNNTAKQANRVETNTTGTLSGDTLELSEGAQQYAQLNRDVRASLDSSESDEASRVEALSQKISSGTYQPDMDAVVQRITTSMA